MNYIRPGLGSLNVYLTVTTSLATPSLWKGWDLGWDGREWDPGEGGRGGRTSLNVTFSSANQTNKSFPVLIVCVSLFLHFQTIPFLKIGCCFRSCVSNSVKDLSLERAFVSSTVFLFVTQSHWQSEITFGTKLSKSDHHHFKNFCSIWKSCSVACSYWLWKRCAKNVNIFSKDIFGRKSKMINEANQVGTPSLLIQFPFDICLGGEMQRNLLLLRCFDCFVLRRMNHLPHHRPHSSSRPFKVELKACVTEWRWGSQAD